MMTHKPSYQDLEYRIQALEKEVERLRNTESSIKESDERYQSVVDTVPHLIYRLNRQGELIFANKAFCRFLGTDLEALLGTTNSDYYDAVRAAKYDADNEWVMSHSCRLTQVEEYVHPTTGEVEFMEVTKVPLHNDKGETIGMQGIFWPITRRVKAERALKQNEKRLRTIFEAAQNVSFVMTDPTAPQSPILEFSPGAEKLFGYKREEVLGRSVSELHAPESWDNLASVIEKIHENPAGHSTETNLIRKSGEKFPAQHSLYPLFGVNGELTGLLKISIDISRQKATEASMAQSIKEKEVLLKEIHHRVKNNLQVISSLLALQSNRLKNPELAAPFKDSQSRIRSIALLHERLYQSKNLSTVNMAHYLESLICDLARTQQDQYRNIDMDVQCQSIDLPVELAVPCGLVLNELLTNAFKYAFPPLYHDRGEIRVRFIQNDAGDFYLEIADNGIGMAKLSEDGEGDSLGLHLVRILVEDQLSGSLSLTNDGGTQFRITFPARKVPAIS